MTDNLASSMPERKNFDFGVFICSFGAFDFDGRKGGGAFLPAAKGLGSFLLGCFGFSFRGIDGIVGFPFDDFNSCFKAEGLIRVMDTVDSSDGVVMGLLVHEILEDKSSFRVGGKDFAFCKGAFRLILDASKKSGGDIPRGFRDGSF